VFQLSLVKDAMADVDVEPPDAGAVAAEQESAPIEKSEDWSRNYAYSASRSAREMEEEAARLEALLVKTSSSLAKLGAAEERLASRQLSSSHSAPRLAPMGTKLEALEVAPPQTPARSGAASPPRAESSPPRSAKHKEVISRLKRDAKRAAPPAKSGLLAYNPMLREERLGIPPFAAFADMAPLQ